MQRAISMQRVACMCCTISIEPFANLGSTLTALMQLLTMWRQMAKAHMHGEKYMNNKMLPSLDTAFAISKFRLHSQLAAVASGYQIASDDSLCSVMGSVHDATVSSSWQHLL